MSCLKLQDLHDLPAAGDLDPEHVRLYVKVGRQLREVEAVEIDDDGDAVFELGGVIG